METNITQSQVTDMVKALAGSHSLSVGAAKLKNMIDEAVHSQFTGRFEILSHDDLMVGTTSRKEDQLQEEGFRSGYWHGYSAALDDWEKTMGKRTPEWQKVAQFYDNNISPWRHGQGEWGKTLHERISPPQYYNK